MLEFWFAALGSKNWFITTFLIKAQLISLHLVCPKTDENRPATITWHWKSRRSTLLFTVSQSPGFPILNCPLLHCVKLRSLEMWFHWIRAANRWHVFAWLQISHSVFTMPTTLFSTPGCYVSLRALGEKLIHANDRLESSMLFPTLFEGFHVQKGIVYRSSERICDDASFIYGYLSIWIRAAKKWHVFAWLQISHIVSPCQPLCFQQSVSDTSVKYSDIVN